MQSEKTRCDRQLQGFTGACSSKTMRSVSVQENLIVLTFAAEKRSLCYHVTSALRVTDLQDRKTHSADL